MNHFCGIKQTSPGHTNVLYTNFKSNVMETFRVFVSERQPNQFSTCLDGKLSVERLVYLQLCLVIPFFSFFLFWSHQMRMKF